MRKMDRLPHEERNVSDGLPADGLPADFLPTDSDVEGHRAGFPSGEELGTQLPGTGGDLRSPSGGGEVIDDVEGHRGGLPSGENLGPQLPGTGGDYRRPSGGELTNDDVEGHTGT